MTIPNKLNKNSHIRVIAPARSMSLIGQERKDMATAFLNKIGLSVSFGKHIDEMDRFDSSSVQSRLDDLHEAFSDKNVDGILTVIGGYNSNQLLQHIDYDLIRQNPKILCGYSDITALSNAIYAKTGLVGYSGPHFSSFSMELGFEYSLSYFEHCLFSSDPFDVEPSSDWSDDLWFMDQKNRKFEPNDGYTLLNGNNGKVSGRIIGGHLRCLNALQGTEFWPSLNDCILFVEEDEEICAELFDRQIQSILHQRDADGIKAIIVGRFQKASNIDIETLSEIFKNKKELKNIPVIVNANFGHTTPIFTYPIGGTAEITIADSKVSIKIVEH